jgi:hypothetical protein
MFFAILALEAIRMLRTLVALAALFGLLAGGCQKKAGTTVVKTPPSVVDRSVYESDLVKESNANPFAKPAQSSAVAMAPGAPAGKDQDSAAKVSQLAAQAAPEDVAKVRKMLLETAPRHGFELDKEQQFMSSETYHISKLSVDKSVERIVAKMVELKAGFDSNEVRKYTEQFMVSLDQASTAKQAEKDKVHTPQGGEVEKTTQAKPLDLKPGGELTGEWQSLREVTRNNVYTVNHSTSYHELLTLTRNGKVRWVRFRGGTEFSNEEYKYEYDKAAGELTLIDPKSGKESQKLMVYTVATDPGAVYVETPGMERLTVFTPIKGAK